MIRSDWLTYMLDLFASVVHHFPQMLKQLAAVKLLMPLVFDKVPAK